MKTIAFFSLKGGTGKTILSSNIGWLLAEGGRSVLMIDLDPQGHLTQSFQVKPAKNQSSLYQVLIHEHSLAEAIVPTSHPRLSLIPATEEHLYLNNDLISKPWREWKLKDALSALYPFPYDLVIMDVGASLSLITYNALFAAQILVIPALPDLYSYFSLKTLFTFLEKTSQDFKYDFKMIWVLLNKLNNYRPLDRENRDALKKYYSKFLMPTMIREDMKFSQAARSQIPVTTYAPQSTAARDLKKVVQFLDRILSEPKPSENKNKEIGHERCL
jgi:chromosome partitioning protein